MSSARETERIQTVIIYPRKDEVADYLEQYAARFELPVRTGVMVDRLSREDGRFVVTAGGMQIEVEDAVSFPRPRPRAPSPATRTTRASRQARAPPKPERAPRERGHTVARGSPSGLPNYRGGCLMKATYMQSTPATNPSRTTRFVRYYSLLTARGVFAVI